MAVGEVAKILCLLRFSFLHGPDVFLERALDLESHRSSYETFFAIYPGALSEPKFLTSPVKISQGCSERNNLPKAHSQ